MSEQTPEVRQCAAVKKNGERCRSRPLLDDEVCLLHSDRANEVRAAAVQASADSRREQVEEREEANETAKLTLQQALTRKVAVERDAIINALVNRAKDGDMRAQVIVWERIEGKVADHLITEAGDPFTMSEEQLARWLSEPAPSGPVDNAPDGH